MGFIKDRRAAAGADVPNALIAKRNIMNLVEWREGTGNKVDQCFMVYRSVTTLHM